MKKFVIILFILFNYSIANAQNQYEGKESIQVNDVVYKFNWNFPPGRIFEYENSNNKLITNFLITKLGDTIDLGHIRKIKLAQEGQDAEIIKKVFSKEEILLFKNSFPTDFDQNLYNAYKPCIQYAVSLDDEGNILNIKFRLNRYPGILNNLKPQKILQLERKFIKELKFIIPQEFKDKYKYIPSWFYRVNFDSL